MRESSHPYSCARAGPPQSPCMDRGRLSSACSYATRLASLRETKQNKDEQSKASLAKHGQGREGQPRSATCFAGSFAREGQDREAYRSYASKLRGVPSYSDVSLKTNPLTPVYRGLANNYIYIVGFRHRRAIKYK